LPLAELADPDVGVRRRAAESIVSLGKDPAQFNSLVGELQKPLTTRPDVFRTLFLGMWAQLPNWKGVDPMWIRQPEPPLPPRVPGQPRPKRPPPHDPEKLDWLTALVEIDVVQPQLALAPLDPLTQADGYKPKRKPVSAEPPAPLTDAAGVATARAEALRVVALLRALAASRRADAVGPLFTKAFEDEGVFRDECGRQIRSLETIAVPSLTHLMFAKGPPKQRRYASYQLDRMDLQAPRKALAAATNDAERAAMLRAWGEERSLAAVDAVLSEVDATSHRVRKEARAAWMEYVSGPPPPPAPKRKRRLPGGREEEEEKPDYLTYREIATLAVQKTLADELGVDEAKPTGTAEEMTRKLLAIYDERRTKAWNEEFAPARAAIAAGKWAEAVDLSRRVLAHEPAFGDGTPERAEIARAFYELGEERRKVGSPDAAPLLRQAVALSPDGPLAQPARARVALIDGLASHDPTLLTRAASDPSLTAARAAVAKLQSERAHRQVFHVGIVIVGGGVLLALAWLIGRWLRSRRRSGEDPAAAAGS
jgi:hypothetical protein